MSYLIRRMEAGDVSRVAEIEKENFSTPWSENAIYAALFDETTAYYVAESDGEIIGCCGIRNLTGEGEITNVSVKKAYQNRGIGREMMEMLLKEGKEKEIRAFTLEVRAGNEAAVHLYEKLGFVTEGVRRGFYEKPREDALIMWKR